MERDSNKQGNTLNHITACKPFTVLKTVTLQPSFTQSISIRETAADSYGNIGDENKAVTGSGGKQKQESFARNKAHSTEDGGYERHSSANARWATLDRSYSLEANHSYKPQLSASLCTTIEEYPNTDNNHVESSSQNGEINNVVDKHDSKYLDIPVIDMDSNTASNRSTPTMVRSRPPLPTGLATSINTHGDHPVGDLAGALSSLRTTDFVRKYSRKGRSPSSTGSVTPSLYTPILSPSGCMSPQGQLGPRTGLMNSSSASNLSNNFNAISLVKTRLEEMAENQNLKDKTDMDIKANSSSEKLDSLTVPTLMDKGKGNDNNREWNVLTASSPSIVSYPPANARDRFTESLSRSLPESALSSQFRDPIIHSDINSNQYDTCGNKSDNTVGDESKIEIRLEDPSKSNKLQQTQSGVVFTDKTEPQENSYSQFQSETITAIKTEQQEECKDAPIQISHHIPKSSSHPSEPKQKANIMVNNFPSFESSEGADSVHSSLYPALSSFDSVHDSNDDICLHVTDNEEQVLTKSETTVKIALEETDDEGVGADEVDDGGSYKQVYKTVTSMPISRKAKGAFQLDGPKITPLDIQSLPTPAQTPQKFPNDDVPESPRLANGRFLTHPPLTKLPAPQQGSMDSNELGALRDHTEPISSASDLTTSLTSFDSHLCSSESVDTHCGDTTPEVTLSLYPERKNSKQYKQKSKSDPSGGQRLKSEDLTAVVQAHLRKNAENIEDIQSPVIVSVTNEDEMGRSVDQFQDNVYVVKPKLALHSLDVRIPVSDDSSGAEEKIVRAKKRSSKRRQRASSDKLPLKQSALDTAYKADTRANDKGNALQLQPQLASASATPFVSPENTLTRTKSALMTEEHPIKRHLALYRSHSSASVMMHRKDATKADKASRNKTMSPSNSLEGSPTRGKSTAGSFSPILKPIYASSLSIFEGPEEGKTKRELIVKEFHSTEQQFVESLQIMVEKYMIPLKMQRIFDSGTIDTIFYKINELYMHHATFLAFLERALASWSESTTIGDVICKTFSKQTVIESYMLFMDNFPTAEKRLDDISSKSSFQKFTEQVTKGLNMKLPLKAQIVKPAQRIPRYELLIKRLLENTTEGHADFKYLKEAEEAIHRLALRINSVKESKRDEDCQETLKKLELILLTDLVTAERQYLRHDMVQVTARKDPVCMWLFNDLLCFSTVKRKSGPVNRKASVLLQAPSGHDFIDNTKQRLWQRFALDDIELQTTGEEDMGPSFSDPEDKEKLESDFALLSNISDMTHQLNCNHMMLKETLQELIAHVNKQLSVIQLKGPPPEANQLNLVAPSENGGIHELTLVFPSPDKKNQWETIFNETKSKMVKIRNTKPPEFLQALPITKTRAGMQFTCAATIEDDEGHVGPPEVWVCNSDGYVGHMCLLSLQTEPIVTLNTPVPGCSSRILCICALPPYSPNYKSRSRSNSTKSRRAGVVMAPPLPPAIRVQESTDLSEDGYVSDTSTDTRSDSTDDDDTDLAEQSDGSKTQCFSDSERSVTTQESITQDGPLYDPSKSLMWIGTEDGCIHIFPTTDNIKTTKKKTKIQQSSSVLCIVHFDNKVYVSLANGELVVYRRDMTGAWDTSCVESVTLATGSAPINKMVVVTGKLWCTAFNDIMVVNPDTLETEVTFCGNTDTRRGIQCIVNSGQCVCLSGSGSSKVLLFHATNYQLLQEISIAQAVNGQLQSVDEIIRQHKMACLRITSLVSCRDALWVGTSAGVIATIPLPKVSSFISRNSITSQPPVITGIPQGHTGHVRFLTCIEMPQSIPATNHIKSSAEHHADAADSKHRHRGRRKNSTHFRAAFSSKFLVLSGGDGFEDTSVNRDPDEAGKDDSTNHLLLWHV